MTKKHAPSAADDRYLELETQAAVLESYFVTYPLEKLPHHEQATLELWRAAKHKGRAQADANAKCDALQRSTAKTLAGQVLQGFLRWMLPDHDKPKYDAPEYAAIARATAVQHYEAHYDDAMEHADQRRKFHFRKTAEETRAVFAKRQAGQAITVLHEEDFCGDIVIPANTNPLNAKFSTAAQRCAAVIPIARGNDIAGRKIQARQHDKR
jgi:hypothetical protein